MTVGIALSSCVDVKLNFVERQGRVQLKGVSQNLAQSGYRSTT
jgi:hypothetical protein